VEKKGDIWGLADRGDYPIQGQKLRGLLTGLTELRLMEKRTDDPSQLGQLGVDDPNKPGSTADLLTVLDKSGKTIAALVLGHRRVMTGGNVPEQIYVRRPDQSQAWLAEGTVEVDADPSLWLDRDIANIDNAKIASVDVTRGGQHLTFARDTNKKFVLQQPADHPPLDDYKVEDVSRAFEFLTFNDVKPGPNLPGQPVGQSDFKTTDGMTIHVTLNKADKDVWIALSASGNKDADALDKKVKGWIYDLGSWKEAALVPSLDDIKSEQPAKPTAAATPAPAPAAK
jgi:hypothetical protein